MSEQSDLPCRQTFAAGVNLFLQLAKQQAKDGKISVDGLDIVAQAIQSDPKVREKYCDAQFEKCSAQMRMTIKNVPRVNVYGRIVSQPFEHLLKQDPPVLATGQLQNFFHALENILGREKYESFMERSMRLMERLTSEHESSFTYAHLYADNDCWHIQWESFMALAEFFKKFQVRKDWFKRIMQSDPNTPGHGVGPYSFTDFNFKSQMMCVFDSFANMDPETKKIFDKKFSKHERKMFSTFLANVASIEDEA